MKKRDGLILLLLFSSIFITLVQANDTVYCDIFEKEYNINEGFGPYSDGNISEFCRTFWMYFNDIHDYIVEDEKYYNFILIPQNITVRILKDKYFENFINISRENSSYYKSYSFSDHYGHSYSLFIYNGTRTKLYQSMSSVSTSPDGTKFAYVASYMNDRNFDSGTIGGYNYTTIPIVFINGKEEKSYPYIPLIYKLLWVPDSSGVVYIASKNQSFFENHEIVVYGNKEIRTFGYYKSNLIVSNYSKKFAYASSTKTECEGMGGIVCFMYLPFSFIPSIRDKIFSITYVVVNDKIISQYRNLGYYSIYDIQFTSDNTLTYKVKNKKITKDISDIKDIDQL